MLEPLKRALVESLIGAIALGYLLARMIMNLVDVFASPVAAWVWQKGFPGFPANTPASTTFSPVLGLPDLIRFFLLLLIWYVLLRWLYFKPLLTGAPTSNKRAISLED
jgi:hypothetical protein